MAYDEQPIWAVEWLISAMKMPSAGFQSDMNDQNGQIRAVIVFFVRAYFLKSFIEIISVAV